MLIQDVRSSLCPLVSMRKLERLLGMTRQDIRKMMMGIDDRYWETQIKKRDPTVRGRRILAPSPRLRRLQGRIRGSVLSTVQLPAGMLGVATNSRIVDNCRPHVGRAVVLHLDLVRFFESTRMKRVYKVFCEHFQASPEIAAILTRLTTTRGCLPQGAPTSPLLAHLSIVPMFLEIASIASRRGLVATMWLDDIAISGDRRTPMVLGEVLGAIRRHGYRASNTKTRVMVNGRDEQFVTGCVLNRVLSVRRSERESIRRVILGHNGDIKASTASIGGRIAWVRSINQRQGQRLQSYFQKVLQSAPTPKDEMT